MAKHADCNSVLYCIMGYLQELATLNDSLQSSLGAHVTCKAALVRIQPSPPRLTLEDKSAGEVNVVRQSCLLLMVNLLCTSRVEESQDLFTKVFAEKCT